MPRRSGFARPGSAYGSPTVTVSAGTIPGGRVADEDLKELDDLLPPDMVRLIEQERELCRVLFQRTYSGIPEVAYSYH